LDAILVNGYGSKSAAGWSINQTGTNRRVYKQGSGSLVGYRIRDDAGGTGGAKEALIKGGESWSDVNTPTAPFPTVAQIVLTDNSLVIRKSTTADTTARSWKCWADAKTCYLFTPTGDTANTYMGTLLGDFYSFVPSDAFAGCLIARTAENAGTFTSEQLPACYNVHATTTAWSAVAGHYSQRNFVGTGGSINFTKFAVMIGSPSNNASIFVPNGQLNYPNAPDGGLWLSRIYHGDLTTGGNRNVRGWLRGLWAVQHDLSNFADGDTVTGTGALAGRTFEIIKSLNGQGVSTCCFAIETSATVE
jgi:hypothetical protein